MDGNFLCRWKAHSVNLREWVGVNSPEAATDDAEIGSAIWEKQVESTPAAEAVGVDSWGMSWYNLPKLSRYL